MKGSRRVYMDHAATTPVHPEVINAMQPYFSGLFGNPSSIHSFGREGKEAVEKARNEIAGFIGAEKEEVIFTSGGTEADNFAIKGIAYANREKGDHIITSAIEHHAVLEPCKFLEDHGFKVTYLPVDESGSVNIKDVRRSITDKTILISIMHANNEIGTIQPIEEISCLASEKNIYFHTDAVQTFGHIPINLKGAPVDLMSVSAHKLYGPKGVGALYVKKGTNISAFMHGGEQEKNRRAGTENVPCIVGFGKAVEIAGREILQESKRLVFLRDKLIDNILTKIEDTSLNGHRVKRLPNNINVSIKFIEGESMLLNLDLSGIAVSTGSACSSSSLNPSHVISALGLSPEAAHNSLRFTLGRETAEEDIDYVVGVLSGAVKKLRSMSPLYSRAGK